MAVLGAFEAGFRHGHKKEKTPNSRRPDKVISLPENLLPDILHRQLDAMTFPSG